MLTLTVIVVLAAVLFGYIDATFQKSERRARVAAAWGLGALLVMTVLTTTCHDQMVRALFGSEGLAARRGDIPNTTPD